MGQANGHQRRRYSATKVPENSPRQRFAFLLTIEYFTNNLRNGTYFYRDVDIDIPFTLCAFDSE